MDSKKYLWERLRTRTKSARLCAIAVICALSVSVTGCESVLDPVGLAPTATATTGPTYTSTPTLLTVPTYAPTRTKKPTRTITPTATDTPLPTHTPTAPALFWRGFDGERIEEVVLTVHQSYTETTMGEPHEPIFETVADLLEHLGIRSLHPGAADEACDCTLTFDLELEPVAGDYGKLRCHNGAVARGYMTFVAPGREPFVLSLNGKYSLPTMVTENSCIQDPKKADLTEAWGEAVAEGLAAIWGPAVLDTACDETMPGAMCGAAKAQVTRLHDLSSVTPPPVPPISSSVPSHTPTVERSDFAAMGEAKGRFICSGVPAEGYQVTLVYVGEGTMQQFPRTKTDAMGWWSIANIFPDDYVVHYGILYQGAFYYEKQDIQTIRGGRVTDFGLYAPVKCPVEKGG